MTECSQQPSAEKLSDKEWRKAYYHPDSFAKKSGSGKTASGKTGGILGLFRRTSGSHRSVGSGEQSPRTPAASPTSSRRRTWAVSTVSSRG